MKPEPAKLEVENEVEYLGVKWTITHKETPMHVMHRRFLALERINQQGCHERVEVEWHAWGLISKALYRP